MKTKYFIGAIALAASVSACSDQLDEIAANGEINGAEVASKGLTMQLNREEGSETRLNGSGWEVGDMSGLVWAPNAALNMPQLMGSAPDDTSMAGSNDLFTYSNGNFSTQSNIYRGWAYAYYPFHYMETLDYVTFDVNGLPQATAFDKDRYNSPYVSERIFLTSRDESDTYPANVDKAKGVIKEGVNLNLQRIVNILKFNISIQKELKSNEVIKTLPIQSLTLNSDATPFVTEIQVAPSKLPVYNGKKQSLYASAAFGVKTTNANLTTTFVSDKATNFFTMATEQTARMFVAPVSGVNVANVVVEAAGGVFTIPVGPDHKLNKLFAGTYSTDGTGEDNTIRSLKYVYKNVETTTPQAAQSIDLTLDAKYFQLSTDVHVKSLAELKDELKAVKAWAEILNENTTTPVTVNIHLDGDKNLNFYVDNEALELANYINTQRASSPYTYKYSVKIDACPTHPTSFIVLTSGGDPMVKFNGFAGSIDVKLASGKDWTMSSDRLAETGYTDPAWIKDIYVEGNLAYNATKGKVENKNIINNNGSVVFSGAPVVPNYVQEKGATAVNGSAVLDGANIKKGTVSVASGAELLVMGANANFQKDVTIENSGKIATKGTTSVGFINLGIINANAGSQTYLLNNANGTTTDTFGKVILAEKTTKVSVSAKPGFLIYTWGSKDGDTYKYDATDKFNSIKITSAAKLTKLLSNITGLFVETSVDWTGATNEIQYLEVSAGSNLDVQKGAKVSVSEKSEIKGEVNVGGTYIYGAGTSADSKNKIYNNGGTVKAS